MRRDTQQSRRHISRRLLAFVIGTVFTLVLLEVSLRLLGAFYSKASESDQRQGGDLRVLCVGDSFTFGLGAPSQQSYPAQLERMLNRTYTNRHFVVINRGHPGQNSWEMLQALPKNIADTAPDTVMLLTGANDHWNFGGYETSPGAGNVWGTSRRLLSKSSLGRLIFLLIDGLDHTTGHPTREVVDQAQNSENPPPEVCGQEDAVSPTGNAHLRDLHDQGWQHMWSEEYSASSNCFNQLISECPSAPDGYSGLGWIAYHQGDFDQAMTWFEKAVVLDDPNHPNCYDGVVHCFLASGRESEAPEYFRKEASRSKRAAVLEKAFMQKKDGALDEERREKFLARNLRSALDICLAEGASLIVQTYPYTSAQNHQLRELAEEHDLPLVDHTRCFESIMESAGMDSDVLFVPDGHPNAKGYGLMAMEACDALGKHLGQ